MKFGEVELYDQASGGAGHVALLVEYKRDVHKPLGPIPSALYIWPGSTHTHTYPGVLEPEAGGGSRSHSAML